MPERLTASADLIRSHLAAATVPLQAALAEAAKTPALDDVFDALEESLEAVTDVGRVLRVAAGGGT